MRPDIVARVRHAFRLFCIAGTASERGVVMPYDERRLSFLDQALLRTLPLESHATGVSFENGSATPSRVCAMRRVSPLDSVVWHDGDLDPSDAWRTAAANLLGALGARADAADLRHAAMAGLPAARSGRATPLDPVLLAAIIQGVMPGSRDWGIETPSWRSPGHLVRLNPRTFLAVRVAPLPEIVDAMLEPSMHPLESVSDPLRRHLVWGRSIGPVETLRAMSRIDPRTAAAIEGMRP